MVRRLIATNYFSVYPVAKPQQQEMKFPKKLEDHLFMSKQMIMRNPS